MRQPGAALCCCCLALCLVAAVSGRGLLVTDQQAQHALDTVTSAAGDIFSQASQALASSSLADDPMSPWQRNHTIEAINKRAPEWKTDLGYFIRPKVASALHNAENGWGPVKASFLRNADAPAPAPLETSAAVSAETAPRSEGGRRLMQSFAASPAASSAVFAPLAAPGAGVAGAAAPDLAQMQSSAAPAPGPSMQFASLQSQDDQLYSSFATKKHKKIAGETQKAWDGSAAPAQRASSAGQAPPESYPQQGIVNTGSSVPAQPAPAAYPTQGVTSGASAVPAQRVQYAGTNGAAQAGQGTQAAYPAQAAGIVSAGSGVQAQGTHATSAAYPTQGAGLVSAGSSLPAAASAYPAQGANTVNAGSNVPAQAGQAASGAYPAQGAMNAGTEVPVQSSASDAKQGAAGSAAKVSSAQHANTHKAAVPTAQGQWSAAPAAGAASSSPAAPAAGAATVSNGQKTLESGGLQPKGMSSSGGVSLDPNQPNRLPGMVRLAQINNDTQYGVSPPVTPTSATEGTAFAGTPVQNLPGPLQVTASSPLDGPTVSGSEISLVVGTRISTPFFGTGFNFCVDRYFGSFPKVGIVIPSPAQWLLPELQDIAKTLQTTLQLPPDATIGHGITLEPSSDGILIGLPSVQPNNIPDVGIRYGVQIGQAFGYDFGIGVIRDICFITFVTV